VTARVDVSRLVETDMTSGHSEVSERATHWRGDGKQ